MTIKYMAVDLETAGLEARYDPSVPIWCVGTHDGKVGHCIEFNQGAVDELNKHLADGYKFIFHNAAFDVPILRRHGVKVFPGTYHDTMAMAYCLFPGEFVSLDNLAAEWLGERKYVKPRFNAYTPEMKTYCIKDCELTYNLYHRLHEELQEWESAYEFYNTIELPYVERIIEMQSNGVQIDWEQEELYKEEVKQILADIKNKFYTFPEVRKGIPCSDSEEKAARIPKNNMLGIKATEKFNPDAARHIACVLERRGHKLPLTKKGNKSTSKDTLSLINDPFVDVLSDHRKYIKIADTFIPALENHNLNGRVYGEFNQFSVRTGRLSSSNPNMQNVPSRDERGAAMRKMFVASNGYLLVGDLDRIELVVLGYELEKYLGYTKLSDRIKDGVDVHTANKEEWSEIVGVELTRKKCKNGVFALNYGCGMKKFAATVGCSEEAAKQIFEKSEYITYVMQLRDIYIEEALNNDCVLNNYFGRNLYIPELGSKNKAKQIVGERLALNYRIQSTAGDVFKVLQLNAQGVQLQYGLKQLIVVHDECIYETTLGIREAFEASHHLTNTFTTSDLLKYGDVWAKISCEFFVCKNWWQGKIAEDVLSDYSKGTSVSDIASTYSITEDEVQFLVEANTL